MNPYDGADGGDSRPNNEEFGPDMITADPPRWQRWRPGRPLAVAGVAVVALAGGAGVGYAATNSLTAKAADTAAVASASPSASPSPSNGTPSSGAHHGWRKFGGMFPGGPGLGFGVLGGGVVHGQLTVPKSGGGYQTLDVQTGTVTAVSTGAVTVKSADGFTATYTVTSNTVVGAQSAGIGSVKKGDTVFVTATVSGSTATAASIVDITAIKNGRASFGFPEPPKAPALPAPSQSPSS
jgi:hypothetical protein